MDKDIQVLFPRLGHFWMDSGIIGLFRAIKGNLSAEPPVTCPDFHDNLAVRHGVEVSLEAEQLVLEGAKESLEKMLQDAYHRLLEAYYNVSTKNQHSDKHNFAYLPEEERFIAFPKRNPTGVAVVMFDKASRPSRLDWGVDEDGKYQKGTLPPSLPEDAGVHVERDVLQAQLSEFLDGNENLLIQPKGVWLERNQVRPQISINLKQKNAKGTCFLCGCSSARFVDGKETCYPLITSGSGVLSFYTEAQKHEKVCWKCDFIGKFVPANSFFMGGKGSGELIAFFPHATSLTKMNDFHQTLRPLFVWHENHVRNFVPPFKHTFFVHGFETTWAFLYTVYKQLTSELVAREMSQDDLMSELLGILIEDAPLSCGIARATKKGNTWMYQEMWPFQEMAYLFRLFQYIESMSAPAISIEKMMYELCDRTVDKPAMQFLERNRILEGVLKKHSVVHRVERLLFHTSRHTEQVSVFHHTEHFLHVYESILKEGDPMFKQMVETAASLGKQIGRTLAQKVKKENESRGRAKGSLFRLRKCRTLADFTNEIARLQQRYDMSVKRDIYQGDVLTEENFETFKGFCMIAALNAFHAGLFEKSKKGDEDNNAADSPTEKDSSPQQPEEKGQLGMF